MASASNANYELLDFGDGRKLERFGDVILDRPSPAAEGLHKSRPDLWTKATACFEGRTGAGYWSPSSETWKPANWHFEYGKPAPFRVALDALPSGQVGVFPEQRGNWDWIVRQASRSIPHATTGRLPKVLNLFAYTGASTLAAAAAGAEVVHLDASRSVVDRARRNAELSGLGDRLIRWIVEDAMKFCRREVKRGNRYDVLILDPPTYGHGPKGEPWKIGDHLLPLMQLCGELAADRRVLVTCHSPGIGAAELSAYLSDGLFGRCDPQPAAGELFLETSDRRRLPSGVFAQWPKY